MLTGVFVKFKNARGKDFDIFDIYKALVYLMFFLLEKFPSIFFKFSKILDLEV